VSQPRVAIIGGGPGGYEAALVAAQLGAEVTVVEDSGLGGSCVLTDCVPSKTLIATSSLMTAMEGSADLGIRFAHDAGAERQRHEPGPSRSFSALHGHARADAPLVYARIRDLAHAQSADVAARLEAEGVEVVAGWGRLAGAGSVAVGDREIRADTVLVAPGCCPTPSPTASGC